jgi:hypothetical protein
VNIYSCAFIATDDMGKFTGWPFWNCRQGGSFWSAGMQPNGFLNGCAMVFIAGNPLSSGQYIL